MFCRQKKNKAAQKPALLKIKKKGIESGKK